MKTAIIHTSLVAFVALILGCSASTAELTEAEVMAENMTTPIKKVLVVGVSDNAVVRNRYEQDLKKELARHDIEAIGSLEVMPRDAKIERAAFDKYFSEQNINAVLVTHVVDVDKLPEYSPGQEYRAGGQPMGWAQTNYYSHYYNTYDHVADSGHYEYGEILRMESTLFNVENEQPVWHCISKSFHKDNTEKLIDDLSKLLVKEMRQDGVF